MFEKEAEEYAEKHAFRIPYDGSDKFYDDKDYECSKEGFQKGAEFGYNKANEELQKAKQIIQEFLELNYSEFTKTNAVFLHADKFLKESK